MSRNSLILTDIEGTNKSYVSILLFEIASCDKRFTRTQKTLATISCRVWQLSLCILTLIKTYLNTLDIMRLDYSDLKYRLFILLCKDISNKVVDAQYHTLQLNYALYELIFLNRPNNMVKIYTGIEQLKVGNNYMCIHNNIGTSHYFTIIKTKSSSRTQSADTYYLNSSYGSEYVNVSQYTTPLDIAELQELIIALSYDKTHEESKNSINRFYLKYFLNGNLYIPPNKEERGELEKRLTSTNGPQNEIETIINYRPLYIGIIPEYESHLRTIMDPLMRQYIQQSPKRGGKSKTKIIKK